MPLPLPDLDDRGFEELVRESVSIAARRAPRWTDHNLHDPAVTFLELCAWLSEQQLYYLNRIRPDHERKFLRLLGTVPEPSRPARATVVLRDRHGRDTAGVPAALDGRRLPRGTPLRVTLPASGTVAEAPLSFETEEDLVLTRSEVVQVATSSPAGLVDRSADFRREALSFPAFGDGARAGSRLYLGFAPLPLAGTRLDLELVLFEDYRDARGRPVPRGEHAGEPWRIVPGVELLWEYSTSRDGEPWRELALLADGTDQLSHGGRLRFTVPADLAARALPPPISGPEGGASPAWLRATVRRGTWELPPRLVSARLNSVAAVEGRTMSRAVELSAGGTAVLVVEDPDDLALHGEHGVQELAGDGGWRDRPDVEIERVDGRVELRFPAEPPSTGDGNVRWLSWRRELVPHRLAAGNGLPGQSLTMPVAPVVPESLSLQVLQEGGEEDPEGRWYDWRRVEDFDASGPADRHFVLDPETGRVRFGDASRGAVVPPPPAGVTHNLRILGLRTGGGERGNVPRAAGIHFERTPEEFAGLAVDLGRVAGGADAESIEDGWRRVRRDLAVPARAVTDADFETLARATPGLRVARAKALSLYAPEHPLGETPATVTVVVAPFTESGKPAPSAGFLRTVCDHLDRHRLITTEVRVVGPEYVEVRVAATVLPAEGFPSSDVVARAGRSLDRFLDPLAGGPAGQGWPFGRAVYRSEVYEVLEGVEGVDCVESLALSASGPGAGVGSRGEITLPRTGLACAGPHRLELALHREVCRSKGGSS